jgi:hypothetical protein
LAAINQLRKYKGLLFLHGKVFIFAWTKKSKGDRRKMSESTVFAFQSENNAYEMGDTIHQPKKD